MIQPNIILITTDQQRGDCLSINGHPELRTPFLDSLAAKGVNFRRAYSTCPVCTPARRTILSGQHVSSHGLIHNSNTASFSPPTTLPRLLGDVGYHTLLLGKLHVAEPGVRHGFDQIIQSETPNDRRRTTHQRRNDYADWFEKQTDAPTSMVKASGASSTSAIWSKIGSSISVGRPRERNNVSTWLMTRRRSATSPGSWIRGHGVSWSTRIATGPARGCTMRK